MSGDVNCPLITENIKELMSLIDTAYEGIIPSLPNYLNNFKQVIEISSLFLDDLY